MPPSEIFSTETRNLFRKYSGPTPRYTSYPTAPLFHEGFGAQDYRDHATKSNAGLIPKNLSVYVHIPFCHSLCYFCGCNKVVTQPNNDKVEQYLESLLREISLRSELFGRDRVVTQIHFGGGTPNFLDQVQLATVLEQIAQRFHLDLPQRIEIGIEIDPRTVTVDDIQQLSAIGFNRFSVGVQDFCPSVQRAINRVQGYQHTLEVIRKCKQISSSVNVDLITGLPRQTKETFSRTLDAVIDLQVDRLAVYNFAYLPSKINAQKMLNPDELPKLDERLALAETVNDKLASAGYEHIGMDHFALANDGLSIARQNNTLHRNFMGYTTHSDTDLVGLGVSAISKFDTAYAQNYSSIRDYSTAIAEQRLPVAKGLALTEDDRIRAGVIQQLMCRQLVSLDQPVSRFLDSRSNLSVKEYFATEIHRLQSFADEGILKVDQSSIRLTEIGRYFMRSVAATFDAYLNSETPSSVVEFSKTA